MAATTNPKTHKALGRKVRNFDGKLWDEHKLMIVEEGNYHKFSKSEDAENLKQLILATGDREIVEVLHFPRATCSADLSLGITSGQDLGHWLRGEECGEES